MKHYTKANVILFIAALLFSSYTYAKSEIIGSMGFEVRPVKGAVLVGTDVCVLGGIARNLCMGVDINGAHGFTNENYGFSTPGISQYHLAAAGSAIQLTYQLFSTNKTSFSLTMRGKTDFFLLGDTPLIAIPDGSSHIKLYHILSMNAYTSVAPGIEFHTSRFYFNACYNFFPAGNTNFGELTDFQGAQLSFDYSFMHRGQPTSLYDYTHRRYRHYNYNRYY